MARFEVIAICLAIALTFNFVTCSGDEAQIESDVKLSVVQNFTEFLVNNPEVKLLEPLKTERFSSSPSTKLLLNYKLGNRISGTFQSHFINLQTKISIEFGILSDIFVLKSKFFSHPLIDFVWYIKFQAIVC